MPNRPRLAVDYTSELTEIASETLLYIATTLGDLLDEIVLVGGLVPSLLIKGSPEIPAHVGTADVDLGLAFGLLESKRYTEVSARLKGAGFVPDINEQGNKTRQRWVFEREGAYPGKVDFLIQPEDLISQGGEQQDLEQDFAATIIPGLHLAFEDAMVLNLVGQTIKGEKTEREINVCGPGAFCILKSRAIRMRNEPKDSYDLHYMVRHFGDSVDDVFVHLQPILNDPVVKQSLEFMSEDFKLPSSIGPSRAAEFLGRSVDADFRADVSGDVRELLKLCGLKP